MNNQQERSFQISDENPNAKKNAFKRLSGIGIVLIIAAVFVFSFPFLRNYYNKKHIELEKKRYPVEYFDYVEKYSREYNIDPLFVFAVIKTESDFDPTALSNLGARGLTQIMPETFDWLKFRFRLDFLGDENMTENPEANTEFLDMYTPEKNIKYGAYYLAYLEKEFCSEIAKDKTLTEDEVKLITAGYYSGISAVKSWLGKKDYSQDGKILTDFPDDTAKHYFKKVYTSYKKYLKIYNDI